MLGSRTNLASIRSNTLVKYGLMMGIGLAFIWGSIGILGNAINTSPQSLTMVLALALIGAIGVSFSLLIVNLLGNHFTGIAQTAVEKIGSSTYPIYLFHIYFLTLVVNMGNGMEPLATATLVIFIGIPSALIFPTYAQDFINRSMAFAKVRMSKIMAKRTEL